MSWTAHREAAMAVAEWLEANGQKKRAADVRRICRSNDGLKSTCSVLSRDNVDLRSELERQR